MRKTDTGKEQQGSASDGMPPPAMIVLSRGKVASFGRFSTTRTTQPDICVLAAHGFISRLHASFSVDAMGKCTLVFEGTNQALAKHNGEPLVRGVGVVLNDLDEINLSMHDAQCCYIYYAEAGLLLQKRNGAGRAFPRRRYSLPFFLCCLFVCCLVYAPVLSGCAIIEWSLIFSPDH
jgi:hypothetical protein